MMKRTALCLWALVTVVMLNTACNGDEKPLPNIQTMLADMTPDANGQVSKLTLDDGGVKTLAKPLKGLKADSTYRIRAVYEVQAPTRISLIGCTPVLAAAPKAYAADKVRTDAVNVVSCWQGTLYINLHIGIKGTNTGKHYFGFNRGELTENGNGTRTLHITLLHDQHGDPAYYTTEMYLSMPLKSLAGMLRPSTDSVSVSVNTFGGVAHFAFIYKE